MADVETSPLTDEERAELEALRAEKARRERAELEALRVESAAAADPREAAAPAAPEPAPVPSAASAAPARPEEPVVAADPAQRTFGQRMVLSDTEDEDGVPAMPPAQKIVIALALAAALCFVIYMVTR